MQPCWQMPISRRAAVGLVMQGIQNQYHQSYTNFCGLWQTDTYNFRVTIAAGAYTYYILESVTNAECNCIHLTLSTLHGISKSQIVANLNIQVFDEDTTTKEPRGLEGLERIRIYVISCTKCTYLRAGYNSQTHIVVTIHVVANSYGKLQNTGIPSLRTFGLPFSTVREIQAAFIDTGYAL